MSKKNAGYKLDLATQTLTLTADFNTAATNPGSEEYRIVQQFLHDFPNLTIVRKTHARPVRYHNSDDSKTKHQKNRGLTCERMESFMAALPDGNTYLEAYYDLKDKAKKMCSSPYSVISEWFMKQFPKFRSNPLFYLGEQPEIIDFSVILEKAKKKKSNSKEEGSDPTAA